MNVKPRRSKYKTKIPQIYLYADHKILYEKDITRKYIQNKYLYSIYTKYIEPEEIIEQDREREIKREMQA